MDEKVVPNEMTTSCWACTLAKQVQAKSIIENFFILSGFHKVLVVLIDKGWTDDSVGELKISLTFKAVCKRCRKENFGGP